jgi:hypothetical protein
MKNHTRIRSIAVSFLFAFFATGLTAQSWNFAAPTDGAGTSATETGRSICTDASGNVYVVGVFNNSGVGNTDFNIGAGVNNAPTANSNDGYIASYDKNGNYRWHTIVSGTGTEFSAPAGGICTNGTFVWVTGSTALSGAPSIASSSNTITIVDNSTPTSTSTQAFLAKLNCSNGGVNWAKAFGGSTNNDIGQGVCVDPNGSCYVIGAYGGSFSMNVVNAPGVNGTTDLFVAKFSVNGNMLRFMSGGTTGGEMLGAGGGLCYVPGASPSIIAVGSINSGGNATFGSQTVANTGTTANDGLLLEMDSTLGVSVALVVGSGSANVAEELLTAVYDPFSGGVYVCGYYGGTGVTFLNTPALSNSGAQDCAIARYSVSANNFVWSRSISSSAGDRAWGIAADGQGGILVSGHYAAAPLAFSGSSVSISTHAGGIGDDIFAAHYNTNGTAIWALRAGGTEDDEARGIACYVETSPVYTQHVFTTGLFQTSATFGSTTLTADGASNNDFFVARLVDLATPLQATQSQVNLTCNGVCTGSATVVASGGTAPYTYSWSPSGGSGATASNLCALTYTCTITDATSTSITRTFTITQPPAITITTISQTNVSCSGGNNGAAQVSASGGTGALTYNWTPGNPPGDGTGSVTGLTAQVYTVTVTDANSCTATRTFNITQPPALVVTPLSQTNIACSGGNTGAASVTVSGGAGGYSYNWTPGNPAGDGTASVTGLTAQVYTVTVTDVNSCVGTATFNITSPPAIVVTPVSQTNISCNGGSNGAASVSASGGSGSLTYNWTPGNPTGDGTNSVTGLTAGTWTCTVTDANSCTNTATFNITAPPAIVVTPVSQTNISCNGGSNGAASVSASGGTGALTYDWTPGNPAGDGTNSVTGLAAGTYTCTVTDANSCTNTATFNITQPSAVVVTPTGQSNVSCNGGSNGIATVIATGGTGSFSYDWTPGNPAGDGTNNVTGLSAGTYTCTVTDANSCIGTATFNITQPPAISSSITSQTNLACNGVPTGAATVSASGGTGSLSYSWAPSGGNAATASGLSAATYTCTITDANGCATTVTAVITEPGAITVQMSSTSPLCNGGSDGTATAVVSGGTPGYSYAWAPSGGNSATEINLTVGTYTVTVTDANGCIETQTVTVTEPALLTASSSSTPSTCGGNNGTATAAASGGTGAYAYSWAPSGGNAAIATSLSSGTYTCTVTDANGCVTTTTVIVNSTGGINASITASSNVSCNGGSDGSATAAPIGGTGPYAYAWTPSGGNAATETGLAQGTYTCTITDANGCIATATVAITEPPAIVSSISAQTNISCNGGSDGSATVAASGGTGSLTYAWTPSGGNAATASGLTAGTYTCTITDANGCTHTQTVNITEPSALVVLLSSQTNVSCNGGSDGSATVGASGGTPAYSYAWSPSGGSNATASGLAAGTYTCVITDANGCTQTQTVNITQPGAISSAVVGQTNISCNSGNNGTATITASGGTGALTYNWTPGNPTGDGTVSVSGLAAGTWTCTITDANGCVRTQTVNITQPTALARVMSKTDASCANNDGTATAAPSGGTPPYTYAWAPGGQTTQTATAFPGGTYTCTITDANGCVITGSITVNTLACGPTRLTNATCGITLSSLSQQVFCIPVANATNYRYRWINTAQGLNFVYTRNSSQTNCWASWITGIQHGRTYTVEVSAFVGSAWTPYGTVCTVTTPPIVPATQLLASDCGSTVATLSEVIYATAVPVASKYEWRVSDPAVGFSVTYLRNVNTADLRLQWITGIQYAHTYNVEVRGYVNGDWGAFGNVCTVTTPAFPTTQLTSQYCGATTPSVSSPIYCNAVLNATNYQWKFVNTAIGYSSTMMRGSALTSWYMSSNGGILTNTTYTVTVRAYVGGVWGTFGPPCTITTGPVQMAQNEDPQAAREAQDEICAANPGMCDTPVELTMDIYPNPFAENITVTTSPEVTSLAIYNSLGEFVRTVTIENGKAELNLGDLSPGIYIIQAKTSSGVVTKRIIKQE